MSFKGYSTNHIKHYSIRKRMINRGKGAGGSNTNKFGKLFENITSNKSRLLDNGYNIVKMNNNKFGYYLEKHIDNKSIYFVTQTGLKYFMKNKYNIELFRCPDEAYIIHNKISNRYILNILEKKAQNVEGSVETKLWAGDGLKREYELVLGDNFIVNYSFCVSKFLKKKFLSNDNKYNILNKILEEKNIKVLYGEDNDYFEKLDEWINNSL
jgi:hypothetical protein